MQDANPVCAFLEDRYQVSGTGYLAPGTWYPAPEPNRRRGPDTEPRGPSIRDPIRFYPASCILHLASCIPHPALSLI
jgi:hypothetical protein